MLAGAAAAARRRAAALAAASAAAPACAFHGAPRRWYEVAHAEEQVTKGWRRVSEEDVGGSAAAPADSSTPAPPFFPPPRPQPDGTHAVLLDGRPMRTPARKPLATPSRALALAVAAEWAAQQGRVRPFTMPLTALAATALDEPKPAGLVVDGLMRYLDTDGAAVRAPPGAPLAAPQAALFDPVLAWAEARFGHVFVPGSDIRGAPQPPAAAAAVRAHLASLTPWRLTPVAHLAGAAGSVLVALAVEGGAMGAGEAIAAARFEEDAQAAEWGVVEGGHDVDAAEMAVRVTAPALFLKLLGVQREGGGGV